jgi:hypothetical protein
MKAIYQCVSFKTSCLINRVIKDGIAQAYIKAHKYNDNPNENVVKQNILEDIIINLHEILNLKNTNYVLSPNIKKMVEEGIDQGYREACTHTNNPTEKGLIVLISESIMYYSVIEIIQTAVKDAIKISEYINLDENILKKIFFKNILDEFNKILIRKD